MGTIDLNLLPLFACVAETASFSAAAAKLGVPKSSVSRGIASLEQSLGVRLFHRTTRRVALSTAGASVLARIAPSLDALQRSLGDLAEREEEPAGRLRVTAVVDFGSTVLAEIVARFAARYPAVEVELCLTNAVVDMVAEGFDVALRIATRPLKDSALVARRAGSIALMLYASPSYLARQGTPRTPRDLEQHDWVAFRTSAQIRLVGAGLPATFNPRARIIGDDMFFVRETLRQGAGIGMLPSSLAESDVLAGRLTLVLPRWHVPSGQLWVVCHGDPHLPRKVTAFRDFVLESLKANATRRADGGADRREPSRDERDRP